MPSVNTDNSKNRKCFHIHMHQRCKCGDLDIVRKYNYTAASRNALEELGRQHVHTDKICSNTYTYFFVQNTCYTHLMELGYHSRSDGNDIRASSSCERRIMQEFHKNMTNCT